MPLSDACVAYRNLGTFISALPVLESLTIHEHRVDAPFWPTLLANLNCTALVDCSFFPDGPPDELQLAESVEFGNSFLRHTKLRSVKSYVPCDPITVMSDPDILPNLRDFGGSISDVVALLQHHGQSLQEITVEYHGMEPNENTIILDRSPAILHPDRSKVHTIKFDVDLACVSQAARHLAVCLNRSCHWQHPSLATSRLMEINVERVVLWFMDWFLVAEEEMDSEEEEHDDSSAVEQVSWTLTILSLSANSSLVFSNFSRPIAKVVCS